VAGGQSERKNYLRKTVMASEQVGNEVSIVVGRFISVGEVKEYLRDGFYIYFDSDNPRGTTPPARVLASASIGWLPFLDLQLGGNWWRLEDGYDRWVAEVAEE
jgi:hypothetical protein